MPLKKNYLILSAVCVLLLCGAHILGNGMLILACLLAFMALIAWACMHDFTLPMLLFFLPWSPLLRQGAESFSFYTFAIVLICAISVIKKRFKFKAYHVAVAVILAFFTLLSKLIDESGFSFAYIAFIMLVALFPVVKEEWKSQNYDFYGIVTYFSAGIIIAALCAQRYASVANISEFIEVDSYRTITRMCGFYGDPNFYAAQITAALGGVLVLILRERKKLRIIFLVVELLFLIYCGFLSGSKSFAIISGLMVLLWFIQILRLRRRGGMKLLLIFGVAIAALFIATSALFTGWIDIIITRFSDSNDISSFTTGRTELWAMYLDELFNNAKTLLIGKGFTNVKINERASHSTIIQIVFQLGLTGGVLMVIWIRGFFAELSGGLRHKGLALYALIILIGAFSPWLAIDALFFDEFFLLQWYVFAGLKQIGQDDFVLEELPKKAGKPSSGRRRLKFVWN